MLIGCAEQLIPGENIEAKFEQAAQMGFNSLDLVGVGLKDRAEQVRRASARTGVKVGAIYSRLPNSLLNPDPAIRQEVMAALTDRLEAAAVVGAVGVILVPVFGKPLLPDLTPLFSVRELEEELLVSILRQMVPTIQTSGVSLILEPLNKAETHFLNTVKHAVKICQRIGSSHVKVLADIYHMNQEEDIVETIHVASSYIAHVHIASSDRQLPCPDDIDYPAVIDALREINYDGAVALECKPPENSGDLAQAAKYVRSLVKGGMR